MLMVWWEVASGGKRWIVMTVTPAAIAEQSVVYAEDGPVGQEVSAY